MAAVANYGRIQEIVIQLIYQVDQPTADAPHHITKLRKKV